MRNLILVCVAGLAVSGFCARVTAQDPPEKSRILCDVKDVKNGCPGAKCVCAEETLEMTFDRDGPTDSVFGFDKFTQDMPVNTTVIMDVKSGDPATPGSGVQGWSYGVDHDDAFLTLVSVTFDGTDAAKVYSGGFKVADMKNIQTCKGEAPPACKDPQPGTGYIAAIILSLTEAVSLPPATRTSIGLAKYTMSKDPGTAGTLIEFSNRLKKTGSPPADYNVTINGVSKTPITIIDGLVVNLAACVPSGKEDLATAGSCTDGKDNDCDGKTDILDEECKEGCVPTGKEDLATAGSCTDGKDNDCDGKIDILDEDCKACVPSGKEDLATAGSCTDGKDNDCDGKIDILDEDCKIVTACDDYGFYFGKDPSVATVAVGAATEYVISMRNKVAALGFQLGVKATAAGATTNWSFESTLGADANRLIELIITDDQGNSQTPKSNKATSSTGTVSDITRGAQIDGFKTRDFFAFDLAPGVGGPGFTVGYVADTNPPAAGGNKIPLTAAVGTPCPTNEILKVKLGGVAPGKKFSRGDANNDSKINVTDAVLIIQIVVGILQQKVDCKDALDANDDGKVTVADAIPVLAYVFQKGPNLPEPFKKCGTDPTDTDNLTCAQDACQ